MLLDEIIELLGSNHSKLTDALFKTKILLYRMGKEELVEWVNNELTGYPDDAEVPPYRVISSHVRGNLSNPISRYRAHPIPIGHLTEEQQEILQKFQMRESLATLDELAQSARAKSQTAIGRALPMELNEQLGEQLGNRFVVERAWCEINTSDIAGIFDHVRSRLLDFLLELKDKMGDSAADSELREKTKSLDAHSMFKDTIFGPNTTFGSNTTILLGNHSSITATQTINGGELAAGVRKLVGQLEKLLPSSDLPPCVQQASRAALAELSEASAAATPDVSRLRRGLESLKHVMEHAAGHVVATGVLTTIELLNRGAH